MTLLKWTFDLITRLMRFFLGLLEAFVDWFLGINIFEKLIVTMVVPSFFAIVMPVARYYIFETWFMINNPLAVYLIGIVFVMGATIFFPGKISLALRVGVNGIYLAQVILMQASHSISRAPYEIAGGYYVNIAVPALFMLLGLLSYLFFQRG